MMVVRILAVGEWIWCIGGDGVNDNNNDDENDGDDCDDTYLLQLTTDQSECLQRGGRGGRCGDCLWNICHFCMWHEDSQCKHHPAFSYGITLQHYWFAYASLHASICPSQVQALI